ncbi:hypothetical protein PR202_ga28878 [Eleusine coracana subsp. coracana]|uniref:Uncharacterized protein n=1 Tax=Eleusine coracana subsp. coracana TaxID=191504 RepID=A0AAV5DJZ8_ELECO|nr:hypothetical protein PR202_ga28878 [Eleusine coracana subsp. coracana]
MIASANSSSRSYWSDKKRSGTLMIISYRILTSYWKLRAKQANIFAALDKLYVLHNAILVESRFIKAFFFYCCISFLIYMLTSAKQTFALRGQLYFGLCITIVLEIGIIKLGADDFNRQFWVLSKVLLLRSVFLAAAVAQMLHSIFTFKMYAAYSSGTDGSLGNYSWIVEELQDEVDSKVDPDYVAPKQIRPRNHALLEGIGENSVTTSDSRKYNLRPRIRQR